MPQHIWILEIKGITDDPGEDITKVFTTKELALDYLHSYYIAHLLEQVDERFGYGPLWLEEAKEFLRRSKYFQETEDGKFVYDDTKNISLGKLVELSELLTSRLEYTPCLEYTLDQHTVIQTEELHPYATISNTRNKE